VLRSRIVEGIAAEAARWAELVKFAARDSSTSPMNLSVRWRLEARTQLTAAAGIDVRNAATWLSISARASAGSSMAQKRRHNELVLVDSAVTAIEGLVYLFSHERN
jgi:hypothetical protein